MLPLGQRIAFGVFAAAMLVLGARGFYRLYQRVVRGRTDADGRVGRPLQRGWYALRTTILQTRVFRARVVLSVFHSFIFYAFALYLLVNAVDAVDGYVDLRPLDSPLLRAVYGAVTDAFSVLALVGVIAFVLRRWVFGARRDLAFHELTLLQPAVKRGYIARDSAIVSGFIVFHVASRMVGNSARLAMEGADAWQPFGSWAAPLFAGPHALAWRVFGYWGALGSVLLFLPYFPYSKHVHLLMAPLKYFFRRDVGSGVLPAAKIDLEAAELEVGAAKLADLSWPRMLDAYACIQCNRCQDVCPASQTGKALSPAALEINKRMVLNGVAGEVSAFALAGAAAFERGQSAGPVLLEAVISAEAVWACTTCGACMEVCPTQDEQMLDIIDIRRNIVMVKGEFPAQLQAAFRGMERASNPWGLARDKRMAWAEGLEVPTVEEVPDPEVLYWVGCAASYDAGAQKTARAVVQLLAEAGVSFAVLGKRECCTGDSARRAGNELLYQQMAGEAIAVLKEARPKTVLASCPHCVNTIAGEYPQFGGNFHVMHHTEYLAKLVDQGRLKPLASEAGVTFHDPCYLGRHRGSYKEPRELLKVLSAEVVEMPRTRSNAFCCGAGGAQFWKEEERGTERVSENRFAEAQRTLAASERPEKVLAVGCPFCKSMLGSTPAAGADGALVVKDVAELLWEGVQRANGLRGAPVLPSSGSAVVAQAVEAEQAHTIEVEPVLRGTPERRGQPDVPEGSAAQPANITPAPLADPMPRKKWTPKRASQANAPGVAPGAAVTMNEEAKPELIPGPFTEAAPAGTDQGPTSEAGLLPIETGARLDPRQQAASVGNQNARAPVPAQATRADVPGIDQEASVPPARKKWQPKGGS